MATTTFNARFGLKYDTYANWTKNNPVLLAGELAFVEVPAETGAVQQEPAILIKAGDGSSNFNALPFVSAKAADIYDWAKAENKPSYAASEISGLADYISGKVQDTDTQYKLEQDAEDGHKIHLYSKPLAGEWTLVGTVQTVDTVYDETALKNRVTALENLVGEDSVSEQIDAKIVALNLAGTYDAKGAADQALVDAKAYADGKDAAIAAAKKAGDDAQSALDAYKTSNDAALKAEADRATAAETAIENKIGEVTAGKTVVEMINDAKTSATYDDTQVKADIKTNTDAITKLNANSSTEGSVDYKIAQAVAQIMENPDETMNSIQELVTWCNDHAEDALELTNRVTAAEGDIDALEALVGDTAVATQITNAIAAALKIEGVDKYALATDLTAAIARIATLEGKAHEHSNKTVLDSITATKVSAWDAAEQNAKDYADEKLTAHETAAAAAYEAKGTAQNLINGLDVTDTEVTGQFVVAVPETDGKVAPARRALKASDIPTVEISKVNGLQDALDAKANDADLKAIAKSGNVNDLVQTAGDYIIFNCGTSSTVI